jgi:hypothetical protein
MNEIKFPTCVIDNFFKNPDEIAEYANTLTYSKAPEGEFWPGVRSQRLHEINSNLFNFIIHKVLNIFYEPELEDFKWKETYVAFHKIKSSINLTNIHKDNVALMAGVIYLNKNGSIDNGTTIYNEKKEKKLILSNTYNTMICYDANQLHGSTNTLMDNKEERLTIVFFIKNLTANSLPLDRNKKLNL